MDNFRPNNILIAFFFHETFNFLDLLILSILIINKKNNKQEHLNINRISLGTKNKNIIL